MEIRASDWHINQKILPDEESSEYDEYYAYQEELCKKGCYIDGVYINGYLYWHLNFWNTDVDFDSDEGLPIQKYTHPILRDNEWEIFNAIKRAEQERKGLCVMGARRISKSTFMSSYISHGATFDEGSQNVIAAANADDIKLLTAKIDKGLNHLPEYYQWQRIEDNWSKQVTLGFKDKSNRRYPFSYIMMRNLDNGNNEEAIAGTKPRKLIWDEIGKSNMKKALQAALPGFSTPYGWTCSPILVGCVCAGTKVYTKEGVLKNIEDIVQEDGLLGYDGDKVVPQEINWFKKPALKPCYRITTDGGQFIECSDDHPLLMTRKDIKKQIRGLHLKRMYYEEAKNIKVNDQLLIPSEINYFGSVNIDYARELGMLIGDGSYGSSHASLSCVDDEIYAYIKSKYKVYDGKKYTMSDGREYNQLGIAGFISKVSQHGMKGQTKDNKRFPKDIYTWDRQSVSNFLGGYFDADGNVYYNKRKDITRIVLTSVVFELLDETRHLLQKFGIQCSIIKEMRNQTPSEEYKGQKDHIYRLYINKQHDIDLFRENIHLLIGYKRDALNRTKKGQSKPIDGHFEINPKNNKEGYFKSDILKSLRTIRVKKVEYIGEKEVYNLNCGPNHNYISNGFITRQTGGDMDNFLDAKELFTSPDVYNFIEFPHKTKENQSHGLFLGAKYRLEGKESSNLADFVGKSESKELQKIPMQISNEEKALDITIKELEKRRLAGDPSAYNKEKMYFPIEPEDIFVSGNSNMFNVEAIKRQIQFIQDKGIKGNYVEMVHDGVSIKTKPSNKKPIQAFPTPKTAELDAPIVMWEPPVSDKKFALYVAGHDSYQKDGQTIHSDSLGALYIYKRIYSLSGDGFQDMLVASYVARPKDKSYFNEQCRLLIKYYNAFTLAENNELSFIDYMKGKNDAVKYLAPQPQWLKAVTPFSTQNQSFGVSRSSDKVQSFLEELTSNYIDEVIHKELDKEGSVISEVIGVSRIYDIPLLQELLTYERGKNADRYVAFSLALAQANDLNPVLNPIKEKKTDTMSSVLSNKAGKRSTFGKTKNTLIQKRKRR